MKAEGSHGVIVHRDGNVYYRYGHHGEYQGSEPLHGVPQQTRNQAELKIRQLMVDAGVTSVEVLNDITR